MQLTMKSTRGPIAILVYDVNKNMLIDYTQEQEYNNNNNKGESCTLFI